MGLLNFLKKPKKTTKKKTKLKKPAKKKPVKKKPAKIIKKVKKTPAEKEIGRVIHYFGKISVGIIKLKMPLAVGERIHIKGAHDDFKQIVKSIQINHKDISRAPRGSEIGIKVTKKAHVNDKVYQVVPK